MLSRIVMAYNYIISLQNIGHVFTYFTLLPYKQRHEKLEIPLLLTKVSDFFLIAKHIPVYT